MGLLLAIRFGLLEGIVLPGRPDPQMLLIAAFLLTGAQGVDTLANVAKGALKKP
jgi:hypothetical protein